MTAPDTWAELGRRLGAPGAEGMRDRGPGVALVGAFIVAAMYAQGGIARTLASAMLLAVLIRPGPGGTSMLQAVTTGLSELLEGPKR